VEHRLTKTGRPFGKMIMEDYSGKFEFMLWSDDYLKFKSFLMPGLFLFVEGSVLRKTWGEQNLEFKIRNMELLNELGVKRTKGLQLKMNAVTINPGLISQIEMLCQEYSGGTPLYLKLRDEGENISLELLSRKFRVKPVNEMVSKIRRLPEVDVEIVY
jgi:DNA polymerase-3 subunit alpha